MYNLIEDYLDRMTVPLVHRLPYHERQRIRQEVRDHLLERVQELTAQGVSADEAVTVVLRQFGSPEWVGTLLLEKRQPIARLNWWWALLLILIIGATSLSLALGSYRNQTDPRQQMVVDVMLWTADKGVLMSQTAREALSDLPKFDIGPLSIPPLARPRAVAEPSLRALANLIEQNYGEWLDEKVSSRYRRVELPQLEFVPQPASPEGFVVLQPRLITLPNSVCREPMGCTSYSYPPAASVIALWVAGSLMVGAFLTGLIMRRGRWVAITALASVAVSLLWCAVLAEQVDVSYANR